jgi:hypothetical protein
MKKTALIALVAGLAVSSAYAQNDPKAAAKAAKEAAAKAKEAAKEAAVEKAKEEAKAKAEEKGEKTAAKVEKAQAAKASAADEAKKAEDEANAKIWGQIERLEQIATATNNAELTTVVARLKEKATKRHEHAGGMMAKK